MARGDKHTFGLHGTDIQSAQSIQEGGFRSNGYPVSFAVGDEAFSMASKHGARRAKESGHSKYAIVQATFPPTPEEFGIAGDQVNIPKPIVDLGLIVVRNVLIIPMPKKLGFDEYWELQLEGATNDAERNEVLKRMEIARKALGGWG